MEHREQNHRTGSVGRLLIIALPIALLLVDLGLVAWKVRLFYFISVPLWQYITLVWGIITGVVAFVGGVGPVVRILRAILTGRPGRQLISIDRVVLGAARAISRLLRRPGVSPLLSVVLSGIAIVVLWISPLPKLQPSSSGVAVVTLGSARGADDKLIYVADRANSRVIVFRSSNLHEVLTTIPIGTQGNSEGRGTPESLLELHRGNLQVLFVTDPANGKVHVVDIQSNAEIPPGLATGDTPRSMAITRDGRKLFVSNEQPIPTAGIMVFDVSSDNPRDFHLISKITRLNCPEGMALSPWGVRLYVATQCGGGMDPVFIIDTATDQIVGSVPGLAVGTSVAVNRDGTELFVSRGNFPCTLPGTTQVGSPLSVVDTKAVRIRYSVCLQMSGGIVAISHDSDERYLFVANGQRLSVFDTKHIDENPTPINDIQLEGPVEALGISDDNSVYAFIPQSRRLFLYSANGLVSP